MHFLKGIFTAQRLELNWYTFITYIASGTLQIPLHAGIYLQMVLGESTEGFHVRSLINSL